VVPHTHWDREWYLPFQEFRARLVGMLDRLLDTLEADPSFTHFHLDGQTILLEDYLEIRPAARPRLVRLARTGRVSVGPWYVLADNLLVSGEAIIRNLQIGHALARAFATPLAVGYLPDQFGHPAQMPQILRGFGIDAAVVWRGVGSDVDGAAFSWEALDGSDVFTVYLRNGYMNGFRLVDEPQALRWRLEGIVAAVPPDRRGDAVLVMNGMDHQDVEPGLPATLRAARDGLAGVSVEIGSLPDYLARARSAPGPLPRHHGELRSAFRAHLLPGVTSARVRQKQRDFANVGRLERWAEPLATWADLLAGRHALTPFTALAWKLALANHPHDSICGCSIDQVHRDMEHRFDQVEQIVGEVARAGLAAIAAETDTRTDGGAALVVFNPNAAGSVVVEAEAPDTPALRATDGSTVPVQQLGDGRVLFTAPLTGHGLTVFARGGAPAHAVGDLRATARTLENRWYRVTVDDDGAAWIDDKELGLVLGPVNRFVDEGDRGDEYNFDPLPEVAPVCRPAERPAVAPAAAGPVAMGLTVTLLYRLPRQLAPDRKSRSADCVDVPIRTTLTLYETVKRIDITTELDNAVGDHRLRVHFETPLVTDRAWVEQAFGVVARPFACEPAGDLETPVGSGPQKTFTLLTDGGAGVALFNRGIPEIEARRTARGSELALTLVRAVGWLSRADLRSRYGPAGPELRTPEAQSPGRHRFEYALATYHGPRDPGDVGADAHRFAYPPLAALVEPHPGRLPRDAQLVASDNPRIVVSAIAPGRRPNECWVRCYNTSSSEEKTALRFPGSTTMRSVDLRGRPSPTRLRRRGETAQLVFRPYEILTLEVRW